MRCEPVMALAAAVLSLSAPHAVAAQDGVQLTVAAGPAFHNFADAGAGSQLTVRGAMRFGDTFWLAGATSSVSLPLGVDPLGFTVRAKLAIPELQVGTDLSHGGTRPYLYGGVGYAFQSNGALTQGVSLSAGEDRSALLVEWGGSYPDDQSVFRENCGDHGGGDDHPLTLGQVAPRSLRIGLFNSLSAFSTRSRSAASGGSAFFQSDTTET